jgi:hypothetical protein
VIPRPVFSSFQTEYTAAVAGDVGKVEITPPAYWPNHKGITINGKPAQSAAPFTAELTDGVNKLEIAVTSAKGTVRTYTVVLARGNGASR